MLYVISPTNSDLQHHGILGQKWGKRNGPPYPLNSSDYSISELKGKNVKQKNIEKWGRNRDTNTLYITGRSGSGKSTLAKKYADKNTNVIHLDLYLEKQNGQDDNKNKDLDNFLHKKKFDVTKCSDTSIDKKERWKALDEFGELLLDFSKESYDNKKKVIVEGVQLSDETLYPNKRELYGKPFIYVNTNMVKSYIRSVKRDNKNIKGIINDISSINERINWERIQKRNTKDILKHGIYLLQPTNKWR